MKKYLLAIFLVCCLSFIGSSQNQNQQLYKAITKDDTTLVAKLLIEKADPNYIVTVGAFQMNMLCTAINTGKEIGVVRLLLKYKADVNWKDAFNSTPLMYAAAKGDKNMFMLLLDNGADINANDGNGNTVLTAAKESKNKELITLIEERLKPAK
jgi:uncharacterized protein